MKHAFSILLVVALSTYIQMADAGLVLTDARLNYDDAPILAEAELCMYYNGSLEVTQSEWQFVDIEKFSDEQKRQFCNEERVSEPDGFPKVRNRIMTQEGNENFCDDANTDVGVRKWHQFFIAEVNDMFLVTFGRSSRADVPGFARGFFGPIDELNFHMVDCGSLQIRPGQGDAEYVLIEDFLFDSDVRNRMNGGTDIDIENIRVTVVVDENPWIPYFDSWWYITLFSFIYPTIYLGLAIFYAVVMWRWIKSMPYSQIPLSVRLSIPVEFCCVLMLSLHLYITGWYTRINSIEAAGTTSFYSLQLSGVSLVSTVYTAIFWYKLRVNLKRMKKQSKSAKDVNYWVAVPVLLVGIFLDIASYLCLIFDVDFSQVVVAGLIAVAQVGVAIYFFTQVLWAQLKLRAILSNNQANTSVIKRMRRVAWWLLANGVFIVIQVLVTVITSPTGWLFLPGGWTPAWSIFIICRQGNALTQIMALRPPSNRKGASKSSTNKSSGKTHSAGDTKNANSGRATGATKINSADHASSANGNSSAADSGNDEPSRQSWNEAAADLYKEDAIELEEGIEVAVNV